MKETDRIVLHTPEPASGASRYVYELIRALALNGWGTTLLAPDNFEYRNELAGHAGVEFSGLGQRANDSERGLWGRTLDNLRFLVSSCRAQYQNTNRAQVIHFQFPLHLPFGMVPFLLARLRRNKIIFTAHDPVPHKSLFPAPWNRIERWSLARIYGLSDRVIVHSAAGLRTVRDEFSIPEEKLVIIAHGPFSLPAAEATLASDCLRVLLFGALRENKGIHLAIQAVQNLIEKGMPIRLTIAGDTPNGKEEAYWSTCKQLLARSSEGIQVIKRYIQDEEIPGLLAGTHCVLLPYTNFSSDSGIAALALSNGKPIVSTTSGGLGELLKAADLGIRIEEPTVSGIEKGLSTAWLAGADELARLGQNGAEHVQENCSWHSAAQKTGDLYRELGQSADQVPFAEPCERGI